MKQGARDESSDPLAGDHERKEGREYMGRSKHASRLVLTRSCPQNVSQSDLHSISSLFKARCVPVALHLLYT